MKQTPELWRFLCEFERRLEGGKRYRSGLVAEIESHLLDDIAKRRGAGKESVEQAIRCFGPAAVIARELNAVRRVRHRRRVQAIARLASAVALVALAGVAGITDPAREASFGETTVDDRELARSAKVLVALDPKTRQVVRIEPTP